MNNVFLYRMPVGIAGAVSRPQDLTVEPVVLKSDNAFAAYGLAGKYDDDGFFVPLADGDTADKVKGIYVRPYHQNGVPLNIRAVKWLKGRGVGNKDRMVAYTNDKKYVRYCSGDGCNSVRQLHDDR